MRSPPPARISPGSPAPTMGPGTSCGRETSAVSSEITKFALGWRPGPPIGRPLFGSLIAFKKSPVIGPCDFDVAVMVYTSIAGSSPVSRNSPFPSDVSVEPFKVLADVIVNGMKALERVGVLSVV